MARRKPPSDEDLDAVQPALVPMSEEELREAGRLLATRVAALRAMKTEHAGQRAEMKKDRDALQKDVDRIARSISEQGR